MGNTRTKSEDRSMPDDRKICICMMSPSWDDRAAVFGADIGRIVRERIDASGACQTGVRDLLASVIVASIVAAEGSTEDSVVEGVFSDVKRIINQ